MIVRSLDPVRVDRDGLWVADGRVAVPGRGERIEDAGRLVVPGNVCAASCLHVPPDPRPARRGGLAG